MGLEDHGDARIQPSLALCMAMLYPLYYLHGPQSLVLCIPFYTPIIFTLGESFRYVIILLNASSFLRKPLVVFQWKVFLSGESIFVEDSNYFCFPDSGFSDTALCL